MDNDFQTHYDAVVTGTGLTQSMLAAAIARSGRTVLHCDQNPYYSQEWQSMNFTQLADWCRDRQSTVTTSVVANTETDAAAAASPAITDPSSAAAAATTSQQHPDLHLLRQRELYRNCSRPSYIANVTPISYLCDIESDDVTTTGDATDQEIQQHLDALVDDIVEPPPPMPPPPPPQEELQQQQQPVGTPVEDNNTPSDAIKWSMFKLNRESRKFNLDLTPRLLYSRGAMVDLLVSSNISRYAEFKAVTRILTIIDDNTDTNNNRIVEVPVSRGDIFNNKDVSVIDKRMLMKFMSFCAEYDKHFDEYEKYENEPIGDFLAAQQLSPLLQKFILNAIAMTRPHCPTKEALKLIHRFIHSAGRFGNTPFLFTLYGTGELPQAFCRLCAVFGGTYCLKMKCQSLIVDTSSATEPNKCTACVIDGRRFDCNNLITDYTVESTNDDINTSDMNSGEKRYVSRAIVISDRSIKRSDVEHLSLLHIPPTDDNNGNKNSVYLIEVGSSALVAPKGLFVQYLWCDSTADCAKHDLMPIVKNLYNFTPDIYTDNCNETDDKPKVLWSVYYNQQSSRCVQPIDLPENVWTTTPPVSELDFDLAIDEARTLFTKMFPNDEFLPRAPDPNEILFDGQPNDIEMNEPNNQPIDEPIVDNDNNNNNN